MGGGMGRGETKVVYREGSEIRAVRGRFLRESEDGLFFVLQRRDGELRIAKDIVLKVEEVR